MPSMYSEVKDLIYSDTKPDLAKVGYTITQKIARAAEHAKNYNDTTKIRLNED